MPRVRFKATAQHRTWLHHKAYIDKEAKHGEHTTTKIRPPVTLTDGQEVEMDEGEAAWALKIMSDNFELVGGGGILGRRKPKPEPDEPEESE